MSESGLASERQKGLNGSSQSAASERDIQIYGHDDYDDGPDSATTTPRPDGVGANQQKQRRMPFRTAARAWSLPDGKVQRQH